MNCFRQRQPLIRYKFGHTGTKWSLQGLSNTYIQVQEKNMIFGEDGRFRQLFFWRVKENVKCMRGDSSSKADTGFLKKFKLFGCIGYTVCKLCCSVWAPEHSGSVVVHR